jgi:hypothetical protein
MQAAGRQTRQILKEAGMLIDATNNVMACVQMRNWK